jgi:glycosyltransferase involved in cell wall biosynthesis
MGGAVQAIEAGDRADESHSGVPDARPAADRTRGAARFGTATEPATPRPAVSFVVIGRNAIRTIERTLESALAAGHAIAPLRTEVIYVDSASTDGSVRAVVERFGEAVRVAVLTGAMNAAIGRNVGAAISSGDVLFFVDGDVEIDPRFLPAVIGGDARLIHPLVGGQLPERLYDARWRPLRDAPDRYRITRHEPRTHLGGVFAIERWLFERVGGFRPEFRINEDTDLWFRVARLGIKGLGVPTPVGVHHTVDYFSTHRLTRDVRNGVWLYPGALFRRHLLNVRVLPELLRLQRPTIAMLACLALGFAVHPIALLGWPAYVLARRLRAGRLGFVETFAGATLQSVCFLAGLLAFAPSAPRPGSITWRVVEPPR